MAERLYTELLFRQDARQNEKDEAWNFIDTDQVYRKTCKGQNQAHFREVGPQCAVSNLGPGLCTKAYPHARLNDDARSAQTSKLKYERSVKCDGQPALSESFLSLLDMEAQRRNTNRLCV